MPISNTTTSLPPHRLHEWAEPPAVLVIDDDEGFIELLRAQMSHRAADVVVYSASTLDQAKKLARHFLVDCVLLDYHLPDASAETYIEELRSALSAHPVPIFMISADRAPEVAEKATSMGAAGFFVKGRVDVQDLIFTFHNPEEAAFTNLVH